MSKRCCAKDCFNSQFNTKEMEITYHGLPKDEIYSKEWASRAKREDLCAMSAEKRSKYYLCSVHFTDDCFVDGSRHKLRKSNHPFTISNPTKFHNNLEQVTSQLKLNSHNYIQYNRKPCGKYSSCGVSDMIKYEEVYDNPEDEPANIITVQRKRNTDVYLLTEDMIVEQVQDEVVEQADEDDYIICRLCCNEINLEDDNIPIFEEDSTNFTEEAMNIERLMPDKLIEKNDGSSQISCKSCIEKLNECFKILDVMIMNQNFKPFDS